MQHASLASQFASALKSLSCCPRLRRMPCVPAGSSRVQLHLLTLSTKHDYIVSHHLEHGRDVAQGWVHTAQTQDIWPVQLPRDGSQDVRRECNHACCRLRVTEQCPAEEATGGPAKRKRGAVGNPDGGGGWWGGISTATMSATRCACLHRFVLGLTAVAGVIAIDCPLQKAVRWGPLLACARLDTKYHRLRTPTITVATTQTSCLCHMLPTT